MAKPRRSRARTPPTKADLEPVVKRERAARKRALVTLDVERAAQRQADAALRTLREELHVALDHQTTTEILRVISSNPTDVPPVFDVIARSAHRLCDGLFAAVFRFDGEPLHFGAHTNTQLTNVQARYPQRLDSGSALGRAIVDRAVVHVAAARDTTEFPGLRVIGIGRGEPRPFTDGEIALLRTFADQAVLAIENVRLFSKLQERKGSSGTGP